MITVWNDAYCTDAASTNSTTKQRAVVGLAMAEQLLELRAVPFDAAATWADIAIVDLDAHPGDGTLELARREPGIALFDIAGSRWCQAPSETRIEYHVARDAAAYRAALDQLPAFLELVRPQLVQYQAGMDPFEGDGVGGIDGVDEAFLAERDRFVIEQVRSRGIPLVVNLAGGYERGVSERLHLNTIRIMASSA